MPHNQLFFVTLVNGLLFVLLMSLRFVIIPLFSLDSIIYVTFGIWVVVLVVSNVVLYLELKKRKIR